jgi:mRNA-degrading endonuclease RelE of RelBE toxin-antitoxin system
MESETPEIEIKFAPEFERQFRTLSKRYRQIRWDVRGLITQLQTGILPGDKLSGLSITAFKVRVKNSDLQKGKSAGYRIIYQVETPTKIILLTIYSKSDRANIGATEIEEIIESFNRLNREDID